MRNLGFLPLLGLLFIGLKLGNVIDWSWIWVTMPLWLPAAMVFLFVFVASLVMTGVAIVQARLENVRPIRRR